MDTITEKPDWSLSEKLTFRFFFVFFLLYIFFNPNGVLPYSDAIFNLYIPPFHTLITWIGGHILHLAKPITIFTNGSGDTTYDYVIMLLILFISAVAMLIWSVADGKRHHYNKLYYWLIVVIRYYVAITMMGYGFVKVVKLQFPFPSIYRLTEPYGNSSPMGLAWAFIGYSAGYNYFTGLAELACGAFLFFRRTSTLGAVLTLVVASNIVAINYCFDVPVKLLSSMLVVMAVYMLAKDAVRIINFFFLNKAAAPANLTPHRFKTKWKNITLSTIKYMLVFYVVVVNFFDVLTGSVDSGDDAKKPPLYGLYTVERFIKNKQVIPPLATDTLRWNKFIVDAGRAGIMTMNDSIKNYTFKPDTIKKQITMSAYADTLHKFVLHYTLKAQDTLIISGKFKQDSLLITLHKYDLKKFLLVTRGFHWINEYPLNK